MHNKQPGGTTKIPKHQSFFFILFFFSSAEYEFQGYSENQASGWMSIKGSRGIFFKAGCEFRN